MRHSTNVDLNIYPSPDGYWSLNESSTLKEYIVQAQNIWFSFKCVIAPAFVHSKHEEMDIRL